MDKKHHFDLCCDPRGGPASQLNRAVSSLALRQAEADTERLDQHFR